MRQVESDEETESETSDSDVNQICATHSSRSSPPITVQVEVDSCIVRMEVDTGASHTLMSETLFQQLWPGRSLHPSSIGLRSYSKQPIVVRGCCNVNTVYQGQTGVMPLLIVEGDGPTLLGRDWLSQIKLDWRQIHQVHSPNLQSLISRYPSVFKKGLGTLKGFEAKIYVDSDAVPRFHPARSVPFALRDRVEQELKRLQEEGTLEPVEISEWAAPIVAVLKSDKNSIQICSDFSVTINSVSKLDRYPIPKIADFFSQLGGGKYFTKIDLSQAYQQVPLEESSKKYVVVNTHRGLFRYTRLPFGVSSAPGIFQRVIESLLQGIEGVVVYLDDILITGSTEEKHLKTLDEVLSCLDRAGLRVKRSKCEFMRESVTYLGHRIDANGLHPLPDRVRAIKEAPKPTSVTTLKAYLGMLTYYSKFLPKLSTLLYPLYCLLKKGVPWRWGTKQAKAFTKKLLTSDRCLTHFDSSLKLTLACDASDYGLGAVLPTR